MSNDVTLFKNGVPDYLRNAPLDDVTKSFLSGGGGGKRISIRGGVFRLVVDGKEIATSELQGYDPDTDEFICFSRRYKLGKVDEKYETLYPNAKQRLIDSLKKMKEQK